MAFFGTRLVNLALLAILGSSAVFAGRDFSGAPNERVVPGQVFLRFKAGVEPSLVLTGLPSGTAVAMLRPVGSQQARLVTLPGNADHRAILQRLAAHPQVAFAEPNRVRKSKLANPNDPKFSTQWALAKIQALQGWGLMPGRYVDALSLPSFRFKVAVLDTGIDCNHPDFANAGGTSTDSAAGGQISIGLSRAYVPTQDSSSGCAVQDDHGHGTRTAGVIGAAANNQEGVAGVNYRVEIMPFKVLAADGSGNDVDIAQAIQDASDTGANVILLSFGAPGYSQILQEAINYAWQRNVLVVAAVGNSNTNTLEFPAGANHVMGVTATDQNDAKAPFANFGNAVAVGAPGVGVESTSPYGLTSGYSTDSGTSIAAPFVAGLASMLMTASPSTSVEAIGRRIQQSADSTNVNGGWSDQVGYGRINVVKALAGTLRPASSGGIVGQVIDTSDLPVTGAHVSFGTYNFTTDMSGMFRIPNVPAGFHNVSVLAPGVGSRNYVVGVTAGADSYTTILIGDNLGFVSGEVSMTAGGPLGGASVAAVDGSGLVRATSVSGPNGNYWLAVAPGVYKLRVSAVGRLTAESTDRTVTQGQTLYAPLTSTSRGSIAGRVTDTFGNPIANAEIVISAFGQSFGATSDATGNYSTFPIPAGNYIVTVRASGYPAVELGSVTVVVNTVTQANAQVSSVTAVALRVNAGGQVYTDPRGNNWSADFGFAGGEPIRTLSDISGTNQQGVYNWARTSFVDFRYQYTVPNGNYQLTLKFAELLGAAVGQRVFDIYVNGLLMGPNFDIVRVAGAPLTAVDRAWAVAVTTGQLVVEFRKKVGSPAVNGIELTGSPAAPIMTVAPVSTSLAKRETRQFTAAVVGLSSSTVTWSISPQTGTISSSGLYTAPDVIESQSTVTVTASSTADPTRTAQAFVALTPPADIRVNAGGPTYRDAAGKLWLADTGYFDYGYVQSTTNNIAGTTNPLLYQTGRWGILPKMNYTFPTPNGQYQVTLKFCELFYPNPGQRRFNVFINDQQVETNFDIFTATGGRFVAIDKQYTTTVTDNKIVIRFDVVTAEPVVNAIEIVAIDTPGGGGASSTSVSVNPPSATIPAGSTQPFTATVTGATDTSVVWTVSPATGSISGAGVYTAPQQVSSPQIVTVTATSTADPSKAASASVTVNPAGVAISVSPGSATLPATGVQIFAATVTGSSNTAVTWSINPAVGSISSNGVYTAPTSIASQQQVTVRATSAADTSKSATAIVTLQPAGIAVSVAPQQATLTANQQQTFAATVTGASNTAVSWSINPAVGTIDAAGLYTAPSTIISPQTVLVSATSVADPTKSGVATINLSAAQPVAVSVTPGTATLFPRESVQVRATVTGTNEPGVTWSINPAIGSVDANGLYTTPTAVAAQTVVTVTAASVIDPAKTASAVITINPVNLTISVSPATVSLAASALKLFGATITGTPYDAVTWSVSPSVGSVSGSGVYTAPATISTLQTVTITATAVANPSKTVSAVITLTPPPISVTVSPSTASVQAGGTQPFTATVTNNSNTAVTWSLSPNLGSITTAGVYTAPASVASNQTVTVTATSVADPTKSANSTLTVTPLTVGVSVSPGTAALTAGSGTVPFAATVTNAANTSVTWSISPNTGAISTTGVYTPPASVSGITSVTVRATSVADTTKSATASVTVSPAPVVITVSPASSTIQAGQTQPLTATVTGSANGAVSWSILPAFGSITAGGVYQAPAVVNSATTVTVTATSAADPTKTATASVTVNPATGPPTFRVNAGGDDYTDPSGKLWSADFGFTGGAKFCDTAATIDGTTAQTLYRCERSADPEVAYQFSVPNGAYAVTLKLAEIVAYFPGQRVFNVNINGTVVTQSFDPILASGSRMRAVDLQYPVSVTGGQISIRLIKVTGAPSIKGIEIVGKTGIAGAVNPATSYVHPGQTVQFAASFTGSNQQATWSVSNPAATLTAAGLFTAPTSLTPAAVEVTATSVADPTVTAKAIVNVAPQNNLYLNAGASAGFMDPSGYIWTPDWGYSAGTAVTTTSTILGAGSLQPIYQSARVSTGDILYTIPVVNGNYDVLLKFAELEFTAAGQRRFDIVVNGVTNATAFDVIANAGLAKGAADRGISTTVSNNALTILLRKVTGGTTISGINIVKR